MGISARTLGALLALLVAATVIVVVATRGHAPPAPSPSAQPAAATVPHNRAARARAILREWDQRRAEAWAAADPAALAALYLPGSVAGRRDVARLTRWVERGLRVEGLTMQVLEVDVVRWRRGRLTLRVLDRMRATSPRLPADHATARVIELVRGPGQAWRVGAVRPARGKGPG